MPSPPLSLSPRVRYMLLSPPLNNCVITQFSVITRLHRLARTNVVCNNSESITLLAERFPAAPSVEGGAEGEEVGRFALNDIPPALRGNSIEDRESVVFFFSLFFLLFLSPFYSTRQILSFHHRNKDRIWRKRETTTSLVPFLFGFRFRGRIFTGF